MNLVLLEPEDFVSPDTVCLTGRRLDHVRLVHKAQAGDCLRVGLLGGLMGEGRVMCVDEAGLTLAVSLHESPPRKQPVVLLLALPRPKMLKRILQMITTLGVEEVVLLNTFRVEKSYWQTPWLSPESIREQLILGLEQARDTVLPRVTLAKRFKPFVEDQLPGMLAGRKGILAHPSGSAVGLDAQPGPLLLAIGPEGGFIEYEVEQLRKAGLVAAGLGPRILRVETAVAMALGRLVMSDEGER